MKQHLIAILILSFSSNFLIQILSGHLMCSLNGRTNRAKLSESISGKHDLILYIPGPTISMIVKKYATNNS